MNKKFHKVDGATKRQQIAAVGRLPITFDAGGTLLGGHLKGKAHKGANNRHGYSLEMTQYCQL